MLLLEDLKKFFDIREKWDSVRAGNWSRIDSVEHAMRMFFKRGLLSRSEKMIRVENYKTSPFASRKKNDCKRLFLCSDRRRSNTCSEERVYLINLKSASTKKRKLYTSSKQNKVKNLNVSFL